ncbi:MAG TPA: YCF48-related protein [bacterium]|nr:YCF48-related protein [bacterium]HPR88442.1 YCF48-related protein [bacterium]
MKYRIFFMTMWLAAPVLSQTGWYWQNPLPQGNTLNAVQKAGSSAFYAVGKQGTIVRSDDQGASWQARASGVTTELHALVFFNADSGVIVGAKGTILRTRDGGDSFQQLPSPDTTSYYAIYGFDQNTLLIAGANGAIRQSYNGGDTWEVRDSHTTAALYTIASNGIDYTYAAGAGGALVRSLDGGSTWSAWSWAASGTTIRALAFPGENIGLAVGDLGRVYRSLTKGEFWSLQSALTSNPTLRALHFTDAANGYLCGSSGSLYATTNAGITWTPLSSGVSGGLAGITFSSVSHGALCGDGGILLTTANAGLTWSSALKSFSSAKLRGICLADANLSIAVGDSSGKGMIFRSGDGGQSWAVKLRRVGVLLEDCFFITPDSGFVVGASSVLLRTSNGGENWSSITGLPVSASFYDIHFVTHRIGAVVGTGGAILRTTNAGVTWSNQTNSSYGLALQGVHFASPDTGLAVGLLGTVLRTVNGGALWSKINAGSSASFNSVAFGDAQHAVIVGANATLLRSSDRGLTWSAVAVSGVPATASLEQVVFPSPQVGYITGAGGLILRSDDSGASWRLLASPTVAALNAISFIDLHVGAAAGDNGTLLRTSDGGLPVELAAFSGRYDAATGAVHLTWRTASETNNWGFYLERRGSGAWETIAFVPGQGTSVSPAEYNYIDQPGGGSVLLHYRLRQVDLDGQSRLLQSIAVAAGAVLRHLTLYQNHPNPFNAATTFAFDLPQAGQVRLILYDAAGREAVRIVDGALPAGHHRITWNSGGLPSGLYLYRLSASGGQRAGKLILLK